MMNLGLISKKINNLFDLLGRDKNTKALNANFPKLNFSISGDRIILVETQQPLPNQVALAKFLPVAMEFFTAKVVAYSMLRGGPIDSMKQWLRHRFSFLARVSTRKHVTFNARIRNNSRYQLFLDDFLSKNPSKRDLEEMFYRGVQIGDLIYDLYLRNSKKMTVDFADHFFRVRFLEVLEYFDKAYDFIEKNDVAAICVSHTVYHFAIPARIGVSKGIEVFLVNHESIYRIDSKFPYAFTDFKEYKTLLAEFLAKDIVPSRELARSRLNRRVSGEVVDMPYFTNKSPFSSEKSEVSLKPKRKLRVLVLLHDFFDSPHVYGETFFPDFLEWLKFLENISIHTDYEWLLKPHPNALQDPTNQLREIFSHVSAFNFVDASFSNNSLKDLGIDVALTVYGSVAHELPYMGIPVINASLNNPHAEFSFSYTPDSLEKYRETLLDLENFRHEILMDEILDYYFIHYLFNLNSWLIRDYDSLLREIGGYKSLFDHNFVDVVAKSDYLLDDLALEHAILSFLKSDSVRISRSNFEGFRN